MSHLPTERLAALVDESPSAEEMLHLASCAECARERAAFRNLAELATTESARIGAPLTTWQSLRPALVADGVIDRGRGLELRARRVGRPWMQAAAAVLLVAGGAMAGRYSATGAVFVASTPSASVPKSVATTTPATDSIPTFASLDEARAAQQHYQMLYQNVTALIAQRQDTTPASTAADKRVRLAALDRANQVFGEAMTEAPNDPVITGAYLTTAGQREATLRQLNTVAPASMRIMSY
ncbi:MAG TPA: hypothetical protein VGM82_22145 [Gemmatimonadaceae bacterium]|jgi:hypothetical protein